jgi:uncharacterized membrane protein YfcA
MMSAAPALAIASGGLVGFSLGLIGGGGSILATPLLLYVVGIAEPHVAIGTGALAVSVIAYLNLISHARNGSVRWRSAVIFAVAGSIGALAGSTLGKSFNGDRLLFLFGFVMLIVGGLMLRPRKADIAEGAVSSGQDSIVMIVVAALTVGLASGFFGIGGGFLIVPGLIVATNMPMLNAVGTSLLAVGTFGLMTALNYAASGLIDWPVAAEFIGGGLVGGLLGIALCARLAKFKGVLNLVFAALIFVVAFYVLYRSGIKLFA